MDDLIPVRADEAFDIEAVTGWLSGNALLSSRTPMVSQFGGGKANLTYLLSFDDGSELVLRRPPLGPVAEGSHDMSREYRVLSRLWKVFEKAPRALALCEDPSVIGGPFLVMERRQGVVVRGVIPDRFGGGLDQTVNRQLSTVVVDTLVELHAVDPATCDLDDLGHPDGYLLRQVEGWRRRWDDAKHQDDPVADEVGGWLAEHLPVSPTPTLIHNDWRLDNMAVSPDDPGACAAVYDWDMATRGDPLTDLGTLMGSWFDPGEMTGSLGMMPTTVPGWINRDEAVARYGRLSGRDLSALDWYMVFGAWKLGVILQQIYIRWLRGQTRDERFQGMGDDARRLFRLAADRRP
ncbi:MAG: phosphotransferase family protein [Actinobacteria bacterium]|nr:phosphotransferase family protein [Actinomycetota bacterium]